jgi:hypothetical protein
MEKFSKDIDTIFLYKNQNKFNEIKTFIKTNIHTQFDNLLYFSGIFIMINTEYDKFEKALSIILESFDTILQRFVFIKKLLNKSKKLSENSRLKITTLIFTSIYFKEFLNFDIIQNAKIEQTTGLFCLMFLETRITPLQIFDDIQNILVNRREIHKELLNYFDKISELNVHFVKCDEEKCFNECSNDDFNMFILNTTKKIIDDYDNDNSDDNLYENIIGKMINNLFLSKMRIKNILLFKKNEFIKNKNDIAVDMITKSISRIDDTLNDNVILNFIKKYIGFAIDDIDCNYKFENLCWFVSKYFKNIDDIKNIHDIYGVECLINYLDISQEGFQEIQISTVMALGLILSLVNYKLHDNEQSCYKTFNKLVINSINNIKNKNDLVFIKNTNGFLFLMKNLMMSIKMNNKMSNEELEFINTHITNKCDQLLYFDLIFNYFIVWNEGNIQNDKCLHYVKLFLDNNNECNKDTIEKLREIFNGKNFKLSRFEINKMKLKYSKKYNFISELLEQSLSLVDKTKEKIKDYLDNTKIIINPIFVFVNDNEIIIDETTIGTDVFNKYIENKTTIDDIYKYNKLPKCINKRIEFLSLLSIHKK